MSTSTRNSFYTSNTLDMCAGHSGSGVIDVSTARLVAVVSGESVDRGGACISNLFVPNIVTSGQFNPNTCERTNGGVSLGCLSSKLPA